MKPFTFGDVCKYTGTDPSWEGTHIIEQCDSLGDEEFEYSTTQGAWINHNELRLVTESSESSRKAIYEKNRREED
jgi:hypothetical protein